MHSRLYRLIEIHQTIDQRLRRELARVRPDALRLLQLKNLRLRAKTLIARLTLRLERI